MQKQEKNLNIEGLRGIALLLVVIFHVFIRYRQLYVDETLSIPVFNNLGFFGVCIFLILSSYFLVKNKKEKDFKLFVFLKKKIWRLWPEYFAGISLIFVVVNCSNLSDRKTGALDFCLNTVFINGFISTPYVDSAHWYITTLIAITLIFSVLHKLKIADKWYVYVIWLVCSALTLKFKISVVSLLLGGGYVGIICIGVCTSKILQPNNKKDLFCWGMVFAGSLGYLVLSKTILEIVFVMAAMGCVLFALKTKTKFLSWRPLAFLGTVSYSVYIIHQNVSYVIEYHLSIAFGGYHWTVSLIALGVSMMLGIALHYMIQSIRTLNTRQKNKTLGKE